MANATPSRLGQINSAGDASALFMKKFGGEVMAAFEENNVASGIHTIRTITDGKSAQFPATWKTSAAYHTPGAEIVGTAINHAERVISIDDLLVASAFIANIDEAKNHYDVRTGYSTEIGRALANEWDKKVLQVGVLAARATTTVTGGFGGTALTNAAYGTTGATIAAGIFSAAQAFDEKDIPAHDRFVVLKPAQYFILAQTTNVLNKDWGGSGTYADGSVLKVADISIVKSNHLPTTDLSAGSTTGHANTYLANFATTVGLVLHKAAVGTVKLLDLSMESAYDIRRQGTLMVGKYAMGTGILRPECAIELKTA